MMMKRSDRPASSSKESTLRPTEAGELGTNASRAVLWKSFPLRFRVELLLGATTAVSLVVTSVRPQWIEAIFGVGPDGGAGWTERAITVSLAAATLTLFRLLLLEYRSTSKACRGERP